MNLNSKGAETEPPSARQRAWSITRRLAALYAASTAALLILAAGFLYWVLERNLDSREDALLASKIQVLRLLIQEEGGKSGALASEVEHEASASRMLRYYIRILDAGRRPLFETHDMDKMAPANVFPPPVSGQEMPKAGTRWDSPPGRAFVLMSAVAAGATAGEGPWTLQLALDTSQDEALLADYRMTLLGVLASGLVLAVASGTLIARKGMQPLAEITKTAQRITASQLHERIEVSHWPAELVELAAAFDAMLDRLEHSFIRLSQFSADLAHELRTPINNLRGEAEVALSRSRTLAEYQQVIASSLEEHERLSRMIDGLLFVARADNPDAVVDRVTFDARKEMEAVRDFYEALAGERGVEVSCSGNGQLIGDPMLFRRAVNNLLANALHYTPARGQVLISIQTFASGVAEVTVSDTGAGIAGEHLPKIFDRFYRADPARSRGHGGSGLGLAIVASIMRLHGGTASVESELGKGTAVVLRFPAPLSQKGRAEMTKL